MNYSLGKKALGIAMGPVLWGNPFMEGWGWTLGVSMVNATEKSVNFRTHTPGQAWKLESSGARGQLCCCGCLYGQVSPSSRVDTQGDKREERAEGHVPRETHYHLLSFETLSTSWPQTQNPVVCLSPEYWNYRHTS